MREAGVTVGAMMAEEIGFGIDVIVMPEVTVSTMLSVPES